MPRPPRNRITTIDPKAKSVRSMDSGVKTWLFDESYFELLQTHGKQIQKFLQDPGHQTSKKKLMTLASKGWLVGIDHEPEIVDSDGVPGVDFVTIRSIRKTPPKDGYWYDPVEAVLSLPSGKLCVAYDETVFVHGELDEVTRIKFPPSFYKMAVFTRFFNSDFPGMEKKAIPDLAVFLTKSDLLQYRFRPIATTVPIHPPEQDLAKLKRQIHGLPDPVIDSGFELLKGRCETRVTFVDSVGMLRIPMKPKERKTFGFESGRVAVLSFGKGKSKQVLHVVIAPERGFSPKQWPAIERLKRKCDNLAYTREAEDYVYFQIIKESRKKPLKLQPGLEAAAVFELTDAVPVATRATNKSKKTDGGLPVSTKFQSSSDSILSFAEALSNSEYWTVAFLFQRGKATYTGAISVHPPQEYESRNGNKEKIAAQIIAAWGKFRGGNVVDETNKSFRGYPAGIERAMKWIHQQAKKGKLISGRTELEVKSPRKHKIDRRKAKKEAKQLGIDVFVEKQK